MTDSQRSAWEEVVAAAKRDLPKHRLALKVKTLAYYEQHALRRKVARCEAIVAMDDLYQRILLWGEPSGGPLPPSPGLRRPSM